MVARFTITMEFEAALYTNRIVTFHVARKKKAIRLSRFLSRNKKCKCLAPLCTGAAMSECAVHTYVTRNSISPFGEKSAIAPSRVITQREKPRSNRSVSNDSPSATYLIQRIISFDKKERIQRRSCVCLSRIEMIGHFLSSRPIVSLDLDFSIRNFHFLRLNETIRDKAIERGNETVFSLKVFESEVSPL